MLFARAWAPGTPTNVSKKHVGSSTRCRRRRAVAYARGVESELQSEEITVLDGVDPQWGLRWPGRRRRSATLSRT